MGVESDEDEANPTHPTDQISVLRPCASPKITCGDEYWTVPELSWISSSGLLSRAQIPKSAITSGESGSGVR